jgi:ATP-dependent RNA helicase DeaD
VRIAKFKDQITEMLAAGGLDVFRSLIEEYEREQNVPAVEIAAALAKLARGDVPLLLEKPNRDAKSAPSWAATETPSTRPARSDAPPRFADRDAAPAAKPRERTMRPQEEGMGTFRIEVGHAHGVKPGNIVGAIANEAGIESRYIGRIEIYDDYSTLDLPADMPPDLIDHLKTVWVAGQQLNITRDGETPPPKKAGAPFVKKAGDRRFEEKKLGPKKPYDATKKKEHRKGPSKPE